MREVNPDEVRACCKRTDMEALTFFGYPGTAYKEKARMLEDATRTLGQLDPRRTIVNIGATTPGIGAIYEVAKRKGFITSGLASILAMQENVPISPGVDTVFFIRDKTWGGFPPSTEMLSPTSRALVEISMEHRSKVPFLCFAPADAARPCANARRRQPA